MNKEKLMINGNREKPYFLKRVFAYLIDIIIVMLLSSILTTILFNTGSKQDKAEQLVTITNLTSNYESEKINQEEFQKQLSELKEQLTTQNADVKIIQAVDLTIKYSSKEIEKEEYDKEMDDLINKLTDEGVSISSVKLFSVMNKYSNGEITADEFSEEYGILNYYVTKENAPTSIAYCAVALIYYVIMCYFCHGITLGKYIMKLRIISTNDKELNMWNYLVRSIFINLILNYAASVILVFTLNVNDFAKIGSKVSSALTLLIIASTIFMMYREDGRGLHDLLAGTKVISTKWDKINLEINEATVVEEKKIEEKTTKKKAKKGVK